MRTRQTTSTTGRRRFGRGARLVAATTAIALLGVPLAAGASSAEPARGATAHQGWQKPAITAMTRNIYLGANIMRPINAIQGVSPEPAATYPIRLVDALASATDTTRDIAGQTDFQVRARLLAAELADTRPDLVGLQEVALWRTGPMDNPQGPEFLVPNAQTVEYDFLRLLRRALREAGSPYRPVSVNWLSDVEAPAYQGSIADPQNLQDPRDVRLTMRDVILKRVGSPVRILGAHEREYDAGLAIDIAGKSLDFTRGYQWVDARVGWHRFRFVNTHLEAFSSDTAYAQAEELLAGAGATRRTTIMVGDFNSDPVDGSIKTAIGDTKRHWAPYYLIKRRGELHDTWLRWAPPEDGWTSGLSETVDDTDASGFDHRIDFVFARTGDGDPLRVKDGEVTGDEVGDRDPATGLWPSDHAGVVMKLQLR